MTSTGVVFENIYANNYWGGDKGEFYSGPGSGEPFSSEYARVVRELIKRFEISRVVDIGCGDFRVGQKLIDSDLQYVGVDTVAPLIERNRELFGSSNISFECLDAVTNELPDGEMCLIRQVLQHLSNAEIHRILQKAKKYQYLVITEHHPADDGNLTPNKDIVHGAGHRAVIHKSGVYPHLPPFSIGEPEVLLEMELPPDNGKTPIEKDESSQVEVSVHNNDTLVTMLFRST